MSRIREKWQSGCPRTSFFGQLFGTLLRNLILEHLIYFKTSIDLLHFCIGLPDCCIFICRLHIAELSKEQRQISAEPRRWGALLLFGQVLRRQQRLQQLGQVKHHGGQGARRTRRTAGLGVLLRKRVGIKRIDLATNGSNGIPIGKPKKSPTSDLRAKRVNAPVLVRSVTNNRTGGSKNSRIFSSMEVFPATLEINSEIVCRICCNFCSSCISWSNFKSGKAPMSRPDNKQTRVEITCGSSEPSEPELRWWFLPISAGNILGVQHW